MAKLYEDKRTMFNKSPNGIITLNRGDTFTLEYTPDLGRGVHHNYYDLKEGDHLYLAILEPGQKWENALLKRVYTIDHLKDPHSNIILIHFYTEDTEYLVPGNYYYEIKLQRIAEHTDDGFESIDTVTPRTKFVILE